MTNKVIQIEHFTFIISLRTNYAFNYLAFINDLKEIKKADKGNCLRTSKEFEDYLVIYIKPNSLDNLMLSKVVDSVKRSKLKAVFIDELIPMVNTSSANSIYVSNDSKWIINRVFSAKESYIDVK